MASTGMQWGIDMTEQYFYSATTNAFYLSTLKPDYEAAGTLPGDITEISHRWYAYLLDKQTEGKVIQANEYRQPVVADPAPPTEQALRVNAEERKAELLRMIAEKISPLQDAVELGIDTEGEAASLMAWRTYRVLVSRVDPDKPVWPLMP